MPESYIKPSECCFTLKWFHAIIILVKNFDGMKLFLIGGMEDLNFNYCYKITYESGETYDRLQWFSCQMLCIIQLLILNMIMKMNGL